MPLLLWHASAPNTAAVHSIKVPSSWHQWKQNCSSPSPIPSHLYSDKALAGLLAINSTWAAIDAPHLTSSSLFQPQASHQPQQHTPATSHPPQSPPTLFCIFSLLGLYALEWRERACAARPGCPKAKNPFATPRQPKRTPPIIDNRAKPSRCPYERPSPSPPVSRPEENKRRDPLCCCFAAFQLRGAPMTLQPHAGRG